MKCGALARPGQGHISAPICREFDATGVAAFPIEAALQPLVPRKLNLGHCKADANRRAATGFSDLARSAGKKAEQKIAEAGLTGTMRKAGAVTPADRFITIRAGGRIGFGIVIVLRDRYGREEPLARRGAKRRPDAETDRCPRN